jgi:hypothetical protein
MKSRQDANNELNDAADELYLTMRKYIHAHEEQDRWDAQVGMVRALIRKGGFEEVLSPSYCTPEVTEFQG